MLRTYIRAVLRETLTPQDLLMSTKTELEVPGVNVDEMIDYMRMTYDRMFGTSLAHLTLDELDPSPPGTERSPTNVLHALIHETLLSGVHEKFQKQNKVHGNQLGTPSENLVDLLNEDLVQWIETGGDRYPALFAAEIHSHLTNAFMDSPEFDFNADINAHVLRPEQIKPSIVTQEFARLHAELASAPLAYKKLGTGILRAMERAIEGLSRKSVPVTHGDLTKAIGRAEDSHFSHLRAADIVPEHTAAKFRLFMRLCDRRATQFRNHNVSAAPGT